MGFDWIYDNDFHCHDIYRKGNENETT